MRTQKALGFTIEATPLIIEAAPLIEATPLVDPRIFDGNLESSLLSLNSIRNVLVGNDIDSIGGFDRKRGR